MNKAMIPILLFIFLSVVVVGVFFFQKKHLDFTLMAMLRNSNEVFYPLAYEFFHSEKAYNSFFERNSDTRRMKAYFPTSENLDFNSYSYCIFFGRRVSDLYYSGKTTYLEDPSPSYASCQRWGKKFVVVKYNDSQDNDSKGVFLYSVAKDSKLRGVDGM
jgi:hypothetical protein